jgi:VWFA-related protein
MMASGSAFLILALCLLPFALITAAQGPTSDAATQRPVFRAGAVLVTVDAYPQRDGQIVEGLTPADFDILEDGKPQKVETFDFVRVEPALTEEARRDPNTVGEANALAADPRNRVFVAFLDTYHVGVDGSHAARQPLIDTLNRVLAPNDLFGVMTPKMRGRDLTLGRKQLSIDDQLTRYWPWGERFSVMRDPEEEALASCFGTTGNGQPRMANDGAIQRPLEDLLRLRRREDLTLTSLESLVGHLAGLREARTVVLLFTDGWVLYQPDRALAEQNLDPTRRAPPMPGVYRGPGGQMTMNNPYDESKCTTELMRLANLDDQRRLRDLITEANHHNVTFYPINPGGLAAFDTSLSERVYANPNARLGETVLGQDQNNLRNRIENLRTLAENTDGIAVVNTNDVAGGLRKISDDVSAYYLLGYYSTNTKFDGRFRRIQVKTKRPGVAVKARRGYFAPSEAAAGAKAAATAAIPAAPSGPSPVDAALGALSRLRPTAEVFTYGVTDSDALAIVAEIPSGQLAAGKWAQGADVQVVVTGPNGEATGTVAGRIDPAARGALLRVPLAAGAKGPWRVSVQVSAAGDRLEDRATIEADAPSVLLGNAIAYRAAPGPRSPLRPVADFQFHRTERVHIEWPIVKPLDQRQARLVNKTGQPLAVAATVTERALNAQTMLAVDVNLAPLGPGDYVIEVVAAAGAESERKFLAIRVIQ